MPPLRKCKICKNKHRLKSQFNACVRKQERKKAKKCPRCGIVHIKKSAINRCARALEKSKLTW